MNRRPDDTDTLSPIVVGIACVLLGGVTIVCGFALGRYIVEAIFQ